MVNLILMRHSRSIANEIGICDSGRFDAPLSKGGQHLAYSSACAVTHCPDAIYTSDMRRALGTAEIYAKVLEARFGKKIPVFKVKNLRGQDLGSLEGFPSAEAFFKIGGETSANAILRQKTGVIDVVSSASQLGFKNVLVITHTDVIIRFGHAMGVADDILESLDNCQQWGPFSGQDIIRKLIPLQTPVVKKPPTPKKRPKPPHP